MSSLVQLLSTSAALHRHLCPRQVLGVRLGLLGRRRLGFEAPGSNRQLLVIIETDGCAADGVAVATDCWVGRRTLRLEDYGKVAATFVNTATGQALRLAPRPGIRERAAAYAPAARNAWQAQLLGYQRMPDDELLAAQPVVLRVPVEQILSRPGRRVICGACGEEVINERFVRQGGRPLCRACSGPAYYHAPAAASLPEAPCMDTAAIG